jgi:hypothetical protein
MLVLMIVVVVTHFNFHAHPRMNAALKEMFTFGQTRDIG